MTTNQKLYVRSMRAFAALIIVCFAFMVVCDHNMDDPKHPSYEFVPVP